MKNMIKLFVAAAFVVIGASFVSGEAQAAPQCSATAIGARSSAFGVANNVAHVSFTVQGKKGCTRQISANSFYAPSADGKPFNKQILYKRVTKVYKPGAYTLSVALPPTSNKSKGCFYQVDLTYGKENKRPLIAYGHGKLDCGEPKPVPPTVPTPEPTPEPKKIEVCELETKKIITIKESELDKTKHSSNYNDCATAPVPGEREVCELESKNIITIKENEFDDKKHSEDRNDCKEEVTPEIVKAAAVVKTEALPEQLPETGPAETILKLFGAASLAAASVYYYSSRR